MRILNTLKIAFVYLSNLTPS